MNFTLSTSAAAGRRGSIECAFVAAQLPSSNRNIPRISHPNEDDDGEPDTTSVHSPSGSHSALHDPRTRVGMLRGGDTPERKQSGNASPTFKRLDSAKIWKSISNFKMNSGADIEEVLPSESEVRRQTVHMPNALNLFSESIAIDLQRVDSKGLNLPSLRARQQQYMVMRDLDTVEEFSDLDHFISENANTMAMESPTPFWIDVQKPTRKDLVLFEQVFGLHPLTTEDILTESPREKAEFYENYMFLGLEYLTQQPQTDDLAINDLQENGRMIYLVIFENCVLSFHYDDCRYLDRVVRRMKRLKKNRTPDFVMYTLLDEIIDEFGASVKFAEAEVERLDDDVMVAGGAVHRIILGKIGLYRRSLGSMNRYLQPKRDIIVGMTTREMDVLQSNTQLYLRDVLDHVLSMLIALDGSREAINVAQANYFAKVSLDINRVMKALNLSATIVLPLTLITGIFGMNVQVPGQLGEFNTLWPFFIILSLMSMMALGMICYFRHQKYTGPKADV
eukprot:Opistho-2@15593